MSENPKTVDDQWIPPCGDPDCNGWCQICDNQAREDAALEAADTRRKGE